jgi:hypothetical protein
MEVGAEQTCMVSDLLSPLLRLSEQPTKCSAENSVQLLIDASGREHMLAKYSVMKDFSGRLNSIKESSKGVWKSIREGTSASTASHVVKASVFKIK